MGCDYPFLSLLRLVDCHTTSEARGYHMVGSLCFGSESKANPQRSRGLEARPNIFQKPDRAHDETVKMQQQHFLFLVGRPFRELALRLELRSLQRGAYGDHFVPDVRPSRSACSESLTFISTSVNSPDK